MPRPTVPAVAETWYEELKVSQPGDEARGWPFLTFLGGLGKAFGPLHDLVRDTPDGPGWSALLDPDRAPDYALPWLAQLAGVHLTPGLTPGEWREQITAPPAFERGTRQAIISSAQRSLTGEKRVSVYERDTSPYHVTVVTYAAETPDADTTERDVRAQKPAGLMLTYSVEAGWTVTEFETAYAALTVGDAEAAFTSVADFESNLPA